MQERITLYIIGAHTRQSDKWVDNNFTLLIIKLTFTLNAILKQTKKEKNVYIWS